MDPNRSEEIVQEAESSAAPFIPKRKEYRIQIPPYHERFLEHRRSQKKKGFLERIKNPKFLSPLASFRRTVRRREEISLAVPSPAGVRRRFPIRFLRRIDFSSSLRICKEWISHPMNAALLLWLLCVAASGLMLGLLMLGLLNEAFPTKSLRNRWIEINNQILNALFTLMSIFQHPAIFHHLFMLFRWRSEDIVELRKIYCKDGGHRPNEWPHMMVVIFLLHITCLAQYALCAVYWAFTKSTRPEILENLFIALGVAAPVFAGVYTIYSPLGREYESIEELQNTMIKPGLKLGGHRILVQNPEWVGGLFDCFDDVPAAYLSCSCTCCVFGWNMERLGFGNMYVHIVTFLLLCAAPFWIFNISAMKIRDYVIGDVMGILGIVLCVFGLIYGGFWRIQMRKRFKLPENRFCFGSASLTDYIQWMFCWSCALAQEVRTGNFYEVEDNGLYRRVGVGDVEKQTLLSSGDSGEEGSSSLSLPVSAVADLESSENLAKVEGGDEEGSFVVRVDDMMAPPVQPLIRLEDEGVVVDQPVLPLVEVKGVGNVVDQPIQPLLKEEGEGDVADQQPVQPLLKEEGVGDVADQQPVLPLVKVEGEGDVADQQTDLPLVKVENVVNNGEHGSLVRMMEAGFLFIVILVYSMGSFII